jgi:type IV secretion system protein VirB5
MLKRNLWIVCLGAVLTTLPAWNAQAAMAVIDVRAITQLRTQIRALEQQLQTARNHLTQAQQEYQSIIGARGMESLLNGTVRNYLPEDWAQLADVLREASSAHGALAGHVRGAIDANAVLTPAQLAALSADERAHIDAARRSAALLQVLSREALATTSSRFAAIQQLINAIPAATDQKAILDLQARIGAEQAMLQNEATKLDVLQQVARAEDLARRQRIREQAIADVGSLHDLEPLRLP